MNDEPQTNQLEVELEASINRQIRHMGKRLHVQIRGRLVTLSGNTDDFANKRDIHTVVKELAGGRDVRNQIVVAPITDDIFDNFR